MASILIVDDDKNILHLLNHALAKMEHQLTLANSGSQALEVLEQKDFDLVISDLQMPEVDGIDVLKQTKKKSPDTEVLILTGYGSIKSAVQAMKEGAYEYLSKPVDMDELRLKVDQALRHREMKIQIQKQQQEIDEFHEMIARDLNLAEQVQRSLVPQPIINDRIEVIVKYLPMIGVGGDFADVYWDGEKSLYLTIVDVTGHGITAALLVNRICSELRKLVRDGLNPNEILCHSNNQIIDIFYRTGMFLTMFICMIDLDSLKCVYAGGAHPDAIIWRKKDGKFQRLTSQNSIIGFEKKNPDQFIQNEISINSGDKVFLYTDGLVEIEDQNKKPLGIKGLISSIQPHIDLLPLEISNLLLSDLNDDSQKNIRDDIFLIVTEIK